MAIKLNFFIGMASQKFKKHNEKIAKLENDLDIANSKIIYLETFFERHDVKVSIDGGQWTFDTHVQFWSTILNIIVVFTAAYSLYFSNQSLQLTEASIRSNREIFNKSNEPFLEAEILNFNIGLDSDSRPLAYQLKINNLGNDPVQIIEIRGGYAERDEKGSLKENVTLIPNAIGEYISKDKPVIKPIIEATTRTMTSKQKLHTDRVSYFIKLYITYEGLMTHQKKHYEFTAQITGPEVEDGYMVLTNENTNL